AYVIDFGAGVAKIDLAAGAAMLSPAPFAINNLTVSPDGKTVVVVAHSPGSLDFKSPQAYRPVAAKGQASVLRDGKSTAPVELGWGMVLSTTFSADGSTATIVSAGYETDVARDWKNG